MPPDLSVLPGIDRHIGEMENAQILSGGNNPVWALYGNAGQVVLKFYGDTGDADAAGRFQRETAWLGKLTLLNQPRLLEEWPDKLACLQSFEGANRSPDRAQVVAAITSGLCQLTKSVGRQETADLPEARDNALTARGLAGQLQRRLASFVDIDIPAFASLRDRLLVPAAQALLDGAHDWSDKPLPLSVQIASPSDMGGHNMRLGEGGQVVFVDFEFAGRDDPALLVLDSLLHEYAKYTPVEKFKILDGIAADFERQPDFVARLYRYWPLVQMIWILIALNPWRRDHARRMEAAGQSNLAALRDMRLARAEELLHGLAQERELSGDLIANIF